MDARAVIKMSLETADMIAMSFLDDLTELELLHRPATNCNHINWQLGHLIFSEHTMIEKCIPGSMPDLPDGFAKRYSKDTVRLNSQTDFDSKATLLEVYKQQRAAMLAALVVASDEMLEQPAHEDIRSYAPTVAAVFALQDTHWMMHAGQWAVIRRQLGREPIF